MTKKALQKAPKKTLWKDVWPLRRPNGTWQVQNAARWFEDFLRIPPGSVVFMRPNGKPAKPTDTITSLRAKDAFQLSHSHDDYEL